MRLGASALTLATLALVAGGCSLLGDDAEAGDVVTADDARAVEGTSAFVQLPTGRLDLVIGAPVDNLGVADTDDSEEHDAPGDGAFVGIAWTWDDGTSLPTAQKAMTLTDEVTPHVTLVAGGERYPIDADLDSDPAVFVAVADPSDVELEVEFDGVTQTVTADGDVARGAAESLYDEPGPRPTLNDCSDQDWGPGVTPDLTCSAELSTMPYVSGPGWAPHRSTWNVVRLETSVSSVHVGDQTTHVTATEDSSTLDGGAEPLLTVPGDSSRPGLRSDYLVFAAGPDTGHVLDLHRTYTTDEGSYGGTAEVRLRP